MRGGFPARRVLQLRCNHHLTLGALPSELRNVQLIVVTTRHHETLMACHRTTGISIEPKHQFVLCNITRNDPLGFKGARTFPVYRDFAFASNHMTVILDPHQDVSHHDQACE